MFYNTLAIVLKQTDWRQADKLITVYTQDAGKKVLLARGIKKVKSKLAGHIEPFFLSEISIAPGKNYDYLAGAITDNNFKNLRQDYHRLFFVASLMELVDSLLNQHQWEERVFDLLITFLQRVNELNSSQNKQLYLMSLAFILKLISILGWQPEFYNCVYCGQRVKSKQIFFSSYKGGIVDENCRQSKDIKVSPAVIQIFRLCLKQPFDFWLTKSANQKYFNEAKKILKSFLEYHMERSADWLNYLKLN
ncbi:MAG: DNA repair protein RecO [Patescibacteria group bacterium]|nr:DNA repair protein RecO [Patescibacteria group bacterium]